MRRKPHPREYGLLLEMLKTARRSAGVRQKDLAAELGRAQATVSKVEGGEIWLDVIELRAWLYALEIDFVEFMRELDSTIAVPPTRGSGSLPGASGRRIFKSLA